MAEPLIAIEVVFAGADRQTLLSLQVPVGTTLRQAVQLSSIAQSHPEIDTQQCPLGIFGHQVANPETRCVEAGDRVELYRPLLADPKEVRRLRAAKAALKARKPA